MTLDLEVFIVMLEASIRSTRGKGKYRLKIKNLLMFYFCKPRASRGFGLAVSVTQAEYFQEV